MAEVAWHKGDRAEYEGKIYFCRPNGSSVYLFNTLSDLEGPKEVWLQKKVGSPQKTSVKRILTKETKEKKTVRYLHLKMDIPEVINIHNIIIISDLFCCLDYNSSKPSFTKSPSKPKGTGEGEGEGEG